MSPIAATLATLVIFLAPGLLLVSALGGKRDVSLTLGEQLYLSVAGSLVISGWVGLGLAGLGRFTPENVAALVAGLVALLAFVARNRLSLRPGTFDGRELAIAGGLLAFAVVIYFPPFEHILGGRDPGIYVNTGFHLAREGNLTFTDPLIASVPQEDWPLFFRVDKEIPDWSHLRFQGYVLESPATARVTPHGLHLYSTWIGTAAALFQMKSGLYATPFFSMMGALGFFFAMKRLFGLEVAAWAGAFLTVFQIQIWFARFPNSEVVVQFLYATALLLFYFMEEKRSAIAGAFAGVALGSTLLARVENVLFLVPLALYFGWKRLRRELGAPELAFLGGFGLVALHAILHDRFIAWPYVSSVLGRHYWRFLGENLFITAIIAAGAAVAVDRLATALPASFYDRVRSEKLRIVAAIALAGLALFTYFVRPFWHGPRTAPHDAEAFLRMSWYLYPIGIGFAVAGAMWLIVRARKSQVFFLLVGLTFSLFFFYKVRVWHDHYFAMRRFIPVILPTFIACMSLFLASLHAAPRRFVSAGSRVIAALLLVLYVSEGRRLWAVSGHEEFRGSLDFVEDLARHIGDNDVVIFPRREGLHLLELPLAELEGKKVLEFYSSKPPRDQLEDLLMQWRGVYGDVYFVTNYKISLSGLFTRHVKDFAFKTEKFQYAYTSPPAGAEPFHLSFTLSKAVDLDDLAERVPALPFLDVGGSDDLQVSWFHEKELDEEGTSYRWSQRISSIFLPAIGRDSKHIAIRLAGPKEEDGPNHSVEVRLGEDLLGTITPSRRFETHLFPVPEALAMRENVTYSILSLRTETWRPSNWLSGSTDIRDLGIRVDSIEVR